MDKKPRNILLITTDEQRFDTLGCHHNPIVKTPHLDQLAGEGIDFLNHRCSNPMCTPARCSILTGLYPRTHGTWENGYSLPDEHQTLSGLLSAEGYSCGLFGKAHFEPETSLYAEKLDHSKPYYGFEYFHITEDNLVGEYLDWIRSEHPEHYQAVLDNSVEGARINPLPDLGPGRLNAIYTSPVPEELHQTAWIADRTIDFVDSCEVKGEPFFAWCSFVDPHHPWNPPEPYASMYPPDTIPLPAFQEGENDHLPTCYHHLKGMLPEEYQKMIAAYYGMISHIDHHIGRIITLLKEKGLLEQTLIIFTSDHGDYNGDHGLIRKSLWLYDSLLHVPLIVRLPGQDQAGRSFLGLSQHEDLLPTLLGWLGMQVPSQVQGVSMAGVLKGDLEGHPRQFAHYEFENGRNYQQGTVNCGVSHGSWKLIHYPEGPGFVLVNTETDPNEYQNLVGEEKAQGMFEKLKAALLAWLLNTQSYRPPKPYDW